MPDVDTSTQGLWWLKPQDHGPDNTSANMMNARRLVQEDRQLNQQQQRLNQAQTEQDTMLPLRKQDMENKLKFQAFDIHDYFLKQADDLDARQAASEMSSYFGRAEAGGIAGEPGTMAGIMNILKRHNSALKHPTVQYILQKAALAKKATDMEDLANAKSDERSMELGGTLETRRENTQTLADQRLESSQISADARIQAANTRAATWGRHANYEAFKMELQSIGRDHSLDADQRAQKVEEAEKRYNPNSSAPSVLPSPIPSDIKTFHFDSKTGSFLR